MFGDQNRRGQEKLQAVRVRFLEKGEAAELPKWVAFLPKNGRRKYIEIRKPFYIRREKDGVTAVLQTEAANSMEKVWRKHAETLLERMKKEGAEIIIPPIEGELPRHILPLADGRRLMTLFAFRGAAEALKRQGKQPAECFYLLVGGEAEIWRQVLVSMGNEVNHLAIFTSDIGQAKQLEQELLTERGLLAEVFASPKNPAMGQADVVFGCGMEQLAYEHMLKKGAVWIDLAGNRPVLRRLAARRQDAAVIDGFYFGRKQGQRDGRQAEAEAFLSCVDFREIRKHSPVREDGEKMLCELEEMGFGVSGFSLMGKRVKIRKI